MRGVYLLVFLLCLEIAFGLGIATQPLKDSRLKMLPGESVLFKVELQNGGNEDTTVEFKLDGQIAFVQDPQESYLLQAKSYDTTLYLNITVPENASLLSEYPVTFSIVPIVPEEDRKGTVPMNFKVTKKFTVLVVDELGESKRPIVNLEKPSVQVSGTDNPTDNLDNQEKQESNEKETRILPILLILALSAIILMLWHKSSRLSRKILTEGKHSHDKRNQRAPLTDSSTQEVQRADGLSHELHSHKVSQHVIPAALHHQHMSKLHNYVQKSLENGYTPESIRLMLYDRGWSRLYIDQVIPVQQTQVYQNSYERYAAMQQSQNMQKASLQKERVKAMIQYIQNSYNNGHSWQQIHSSLVNAGWNASYVSRAINHVSQLSDRSLNERT